MMSIALLLVFALLSAAAGSTLLSVLRLTPSTRPERLLYSISLGLGVIAYLILLLGLVGLLAPGFVLPALLLLGVVSRRGWLGLVEDWRKHAGIEGEKESRGEHGGQRLALPVGILLAVVGAMVLLNCFVPPAAHEWDVLSYHLAVPKRYLAEHRIMYLPTDHHSTFPFLLQMLFTVGLMFDGYALANLFHFATALLCVAGVLFFGRRYFSPAAGWLGAALMVTTPVVVWESGIAYIEMGWTLYVFLAAMAALEYRESGEARWLVLAGILMGFALSTKTLALVPFVLVALLLARRARFVHLRWYLLSVLVVGSPFYVKAYLWTGNPVYPFAYRIFGGRYWSQELADTYATEQRSFGLNGQAEGVATDLRDIPRVYQKPTLLRRATNAVLAPFALVSIPRIFYNFNDPGFASHLGFLFLALPPLALLVGSFSPPVRWCAALVGIWFIVWTQSMQYVRYMIPLLPFLGLVGGEGAWRLARRLPLAGWVVGAVFVLQAALTLSEFGAQVPRQWARATNPAVREDYLTRSVNIYAAQQWLNANTPKETGVVLYEETRGFYLDRPYLWGNSPHSLYIPYAGFASGREMADWFLSKGIRYALVNLQFSPFVQTAADQERLREAAASGMIAGLLLEWYHPDRNTGERWRALLGDAVLTGSALVVSAASQRGVVALEFRPAQGAD